MYVITLVKFILPGINNNTANMGLIIKYLIRILQFANLLRILHVFD